MFRIFSMLLLLTSLDALADESLYLCQSDEKLIFGCEIGNKLVSLCASDHMTKTTGYAQYRFGLPGKVELIYPASKIPPGGNFFLSSTSYSGGGATIIRFNNAGSEYLIFDSMVRTNFAPDEPNDPAFQAGIVTRQDGEITSSRLCVDSAASIRAEAFDVFAREDFDHDVIP